jgi:SEC-C motif-containing protein
MSTSSPALACPCGSQRRLADCCGRWHEGPEHLQAPTAEALMRSRYSAFVLERGAYLLDTWHPSTRPPSIDFDPGLRWLGLDVKRHVAVDDHHATVEFVARSKLGGRATRLHENSRFVREGGTAEAPARWFYVDGDVA